jgi:hypothetical protein
VNLGADPSGSRNIVATGRSRKIRVPQHTLEWLEDIAAHVLGTRCVTLTS